MFEGSSYIEIMMGHMSRSDPNTMEHFQNQWDIVMTKSEIRKICKKKVKIQNKTSN